MFSVLYNISLLLIYFIHSSLYSWIPYPYPDHPLSPGVNTSLFSIPVSLFLLCYINLFILLFVFHVKVATYKILSSFVWHFTKHNILQVHPSCCNWQNFILFYTWVICNIPVYICVCVCTYIYKFFYWVFFFISSFAMNGLWVPLLYWLLLQPPSCKSQSKSCCSLSCLLLGMIKEWNGFFLLNLQRQVWKLLSDIKSSGKNKEEWIVV